MDGIKSILVDNSFCTRLFKENDQYHENVVDYFQYFLENGICLYLSTIVVSEYAVADDPQNLLDTEAFRLLEYDYKDACISGRMFSILKGEDYVRSNVSRNVIINDVKIISQIYNRNIDAFISKDTNCLNTIINPLKAEFPLSLDFIDLTIPLKQKLGLLF